MTQKPEDFTPLVSSLQSAELDHSAEVDYGLSAEILMETAGTLSAQKILSFLNCPDGKDLKSIKQSSFFVMVLCGPGHNGGDGLVVARHLLSEGISVQVFLSDIALKGSESEPGLEHESGSTPESSSYKLQKSQPQRPLIEKQKQRLRALNVDLLSLKDIKKIKQTGEKCSLIVDALFGVGLSRNVEGFYAELIKWINSFDKPVVSLDTPSGLDVDTGQVKGQAVQADLTLTFGLSKPGFYLMQGPAHTGQLKIFSIGFPYSLLRKKAQTHFLIDEYYVSSRLPERAPTDHKARQGHLLVVAGSKGLWGAGDLAALSAYRMGAGYVTWAGDFQNSKNTSRSIPDVLTEDWSHPQLFKNKTAVAIGPGLSEGEKTKALILKLKKTNLPVVVDAGAFNVCVQENLFPLLSHWVVTPHSGELARLFGLTAGEVDQDRSAYAMKASQKTGTLVLLKGFHSVLAQGDKCWIIPTGHSALAKAGTGDVLTGFIGALMARFVDVFSAVAIATFIHGRLAEEWMEEGRDRDSLMAQDLKDILPVVLRKLRQPY